MSFLIFSSSLFYFRTLKFKENFDVSFYFILCMFLLHDSHGILLVLRNGEINTYSDFSSSFISYNLALYTFYHNNFLPDFFEKNLGTN